METKNKKTAQQERFSEEAQPKKMSKIAEFWASKPNKGIIVNMRAVLK